MKKFLSFLLVFILVCSLAACSSTTTLSISHDYDETYDIKVDYADKYIVNDERVNKTVKRPGIVNPLEVITIYQGEDLLAYVRIYRNTNTPNPYESEIEKIKQYTDPNREKTPADETTVWEIVEDKTTSKNPYFLAKCSMDLKKTGTPKVGYEYLMEISKEEGFSVHVLGETGVNEKTIRDIMKNVNFSVVKK